MSYSCFNALPYFNHGISFSTPFFFGNTFSNGGLPVIEGTKPATDDFLIPGTVVEHSKDASDVKTSTDNNTQTAPRATKNSKIRATAKDKVLLEMHNASFDKNDPNGAAQFVEGNVDVYISAANSKVPTEGDTLESPEFIRITDNTSGHRHAYYYYKLTPELCDGKHFAKFGKNMPIDKNQFEEGKTYYILAMTVDEDTHTRLDYTDHIEIYRLDYSYEAETDTSNYDLIQDKNMQGSGRSSIDINKC